MHASSRLIIIALTRIVAGTLLVPLTLVTGLLTIPTTCQCDAQLPHPHALLALGDHSHAHQHHAGAENQREIVTSGQDGVTVQAPPAPSLTALSALHVAGMNIADLPRVTIAVDSIVALTGRVAVPDVPPPRA